jgi:AcrR family transcriptional regulator
MLYNIVIERSIILPPKKQITRSTIVDRALKMVRTNGYESLTARNLATELNCSTQPIYNEFVDMNDLKAALSIKATEIMTQYIKNNSIKNQNPILSNVLGYVQFANEEKYLFQLIFSTDAIKAKEKVALIQTNSELELNMIVYAHGIVMMKAFGTLELPWNSIHELIVNAFHTFEKGGHINEK